MFRSYRGNIWVKKLAAEGINPRTAFGEALIAELTESNYNDIEVHIRFDGNRDVYEISIEETPESGREIDCWVYMDDDEPSKEFWSIDVRDPDNSMLSGPEEEWIRDCYPGIYVNQADVIKIIGEDQ